MDDLFQDKELVELGEQLGTMLDRIRNGQDYVAAHPEDTKAPGMLAQLFGRQKELSQALYARSWEKVTISFSYPEDHEFGDRPHVMVLDQQAVVRKDDNGGRVIDVTYTRGQLKTALKILDIKT